MTQPAPTDPRPATRPFCGCPVDGYSATCHRGDHRQNATEELTDR